MEDSGANHEAPPSFTEVFSVKSIKSTIKNTLFVSLVITIGSMHSDYVKTLFENDRNFSYLSDLEREMSFRTEMGFYYSYYKTVVEEKPFIAGISKLIYDRTVEYPSEVSAFNRFNIYPEVIVGALYRYLEPYINNTRECHMVDRGPGREPVESCIGLGHPVFFYLEAIWIFAGVNVAALFLHAVELSESLLGGFLAVIQYFANHAECTRVQWAPNERENWAGPLLMLQAWLLSVQLKGGKKYAIQLQIAIFMLNCLCLLFWQFTQFVFLTQIAIYFVMEQLKVIDSRHLSIFLHSHYCGLHIAILFLQGNDMLKSSLYACLFLVVSAYCLFFSGLRIKVQTRFDLFVEFWLIILRIFIVICASLSLKNIISEFLEVQEDSHIWEILLSKFTDYVSFHSLLYTCSEVFDFLPLSSVKNMTTSFLIPYALFSVINVTYYWLTSKTETIDKVEQESVIDDEDSGIENSSDIKVKRKDLDDIDKEESVKITDKWVLYLNSLRIDPAIFYNISQMVVYGVMAALVMRLKLLFTTQMCLMSSLVFKRRCYVYPKWGLKLLKLVLLLGAVSMFWSLYHNTQKELSIIGEFSDASQEELLLWLRRQPPGALAGAMPVLAAALLSARRPTVLHPHYEHAHLRKRAYSIYKMYGRFPPRELYEALTELKATYLIVETKYCYGRSDRNCSFADIWDRVSPELAGRPRLCHALLAGSVPHFYPLFRNAHYSVFRVHDVGVLYMPRSFDT